MQIARPAAAILAAIFALMTATGAQASDIDTRALLKQPGVHAIMRHALAPGFSDPDQFRIGDCSTQRNLNDEGRNQASKIGMALKQAGVHFTYILSSQWCRCRETAKLLGLGAPQDLPSLNSFFSDRSTATAQTAETKGFLQRLRAGDRVMLVTHQVNITALTGRGTASGEVLLIRRGRDNKVNVIGSFMLPP